ncbi:MAG: hypothetical protein QOK11_4215 [Pseudonocardiales bacterium]|nr:hypothetical protein [Pseudonocardiales bacterium]
MLAVTQTLTPTEGIWAQRGLLFVVGPTAKSPQKLRPYAPYHQVKYTGSSVAGSGCTQLIARYIEISGTATFNHNCVGTGTLDPMGSKWTLVE